MTSERRIDLLLCVYPRSWRARHEAEFRDALVAAVSPSGRLPFREVRASLASALRERARGESTTPRELLRTSLHDSFIFVSGLIIGISAWFAIRTGVPASLFPSGLLLLPLVVFVSSMFSAGLFRLVTIAVAPLLWFAVNAFRAPERYGNSGISIAPGAVGTVGLGLLSFAGIALLASGKRMPGLALQAPTVVSVVWGAMGWRTGRGPISPPSPAVPVRMAWAIGFLVLLLAVAANAIRLGRYRGADLQPRKLHFVAVVGGVAVGIAPAIGAIGIGVVAILLAWWNPRPALIALTWPVALTMSNFLPTAYLVSSFQTSLVLRFLSVVLAAAVLTLFLRRAVSRVYREG